MTEEEKKAIEYLENSLISTVTHKAHLNTIKNLIQRQETENIKLKQENEKKDKIIDILAEKLAKQYNSKPRKCSFKEQKNIECNNYENCVDCIKQYVEREVEQ